MLIYTMDTQADGGLALEAADWSGDSGGPALIDVSGTDKIAGVNSNGQGPGYGNEDEMTRLGSAFAYKWIQDNIADSTVGNGVSISDCEAWEGAGYLMLGPAAIALLAYLTF